MRLSLLLDNQKYLDKYLTSRFISVNIYMSKKQNRSNSATQNYRVLTKIASCRLCNWFYLMKKIKSKKSTRKIIIATAMCLISLLSSFTATLAWFSSNLFATTSGMSVRVKVIETDFSSMTVHRCNLSASTSSVLQFYSEPSVVVSGTGSTEQVAGIDIDNYSELNRTQPVLLLFTLNADTYEDDITITATAENENFVSVITAQNVSEFPFSSVVKFKSASYSSNSFPFNNVVVSNLTTSTSFVVMDGSSASYTHSIQPFSGTNHTIVKYIAIVMDYYSEAIQYIFSQSIGFETYAADNDNAVDFYCDWTLEI